MYLENLSITLMNMQDLEMIKDSLYSDFDEFWNYETFETELTSPLSLYFVAKYNNEILGFIGCKQIFNELEIMNIVTKISARGKGIASSLLGYLIQFCKQNQKSMINLEVNAKNTIAIHLYKKYNFKQIGLRKKYYHQTDDAILMALKIENPSK